MEAAILTKNRTFPLNAESLVLQGLQGISFFKKPTYQQQNTHFQKVR